MMTSTTAVASAAELADLAKLFQVRDDITFLNHGSFGACPLPVFDTFQEWQRELERQPVEFLGRRVKGLLADARGALGEFVGTDAANVVFVPNVTAGMNAIARSLHLDAGDEILATDHEYGAVDRTWRYYCARNGARYINQPIAIPMVEAATFVEQLWAGVTPRTRIIAISHITSSTALIFPIAEVCRRAREAGILTVIDGAHAPGQIDLALDEIGADFYLGNCHKWLCAPKGAGFLYARPDRQSLLDPLIISWGWEAERPGASRFLDHYEWAGTDDPAAYLSVPAAIAFQRDHDWSRVRAACHILVGEARDRLGALTGLPQLAPDSAEWWGQMASIPLPGDDVQRIKETLWDDHKIEIPVMQRDGQIYARISIQAYNRREDVDKLVGVLSDLL
ncbi:MAG TPA: aminotransferase class V-fold PLP-dependent enzyme [Thermomicrobiales bacterium]